MQITIETDCYNERRMGRPWIATVDFSDPKGSYDFGDYTGDHRNGGEGTLTLSADIGDIVAQGQKDNRKPGNSAPNFFVVGADGKLESLGDKGQAYKYYMAHKSNDPDVAILRTERLTLIARITEIDSILNHTGG